MSANHTKNLGETTPTPKQSGVESKEGMTPSLPGG